MRETSAERLAVNGNEPALGTRRQRLGPLDKTLFKLIGSDAGKDPAEGVSRGNAVGQIQKRFEPVVVGISEENRVVASGPKLLLRPVAGFVQSSTGDVPITMQRVRICIGSEHDVVAG